MKASGIWGLFVRRHFIELGFKGTEWKWNGTDELGVFLGFLGVFGNMAKDQQPVRLRWLLGMQSEMGLKLNDEYLESTQN